MKKRKIDQLKMGVILSYLITAINVLVQLLYTPVMIRLLGQSEYGLYNLVGSVVSYLSLFSLGFSGAYLRFYSRYENNGDKVGVARLNGMFILLFIGMAILALVSGMVLSCYTEQIFGEKLTAAEIEKARILMRFLVINIALSFPNSVMNSIISSQEHFFFQRMVTLISVVFNPFICLPLLLCGHGSISIVAVTTIITFSKLFVDTWYCIKKLHVDFQFGYFSWALLKEMFGFSFFLFLNIIIDQINWSVDKLILGRVSGTQAVAVYGVGSQLNSLYISLLTIIPSVFAPRINRIVAGNLKSSDETLSALFVKVGRMIFIIAVYVFIGFVFAGREFIKLWAGPTYVDAYKVLLLLIIPMVIILPQNLGLEIRRAKNKHRIITVIMLMTTIGNLIISIPLSIKYGVVGAALGTFITLIINYIITDIYYVKVVNIQVGTLFFNMFKITFANSVPIIFGVSGVFVCNNIQKCILWAMIYSILYVIFCYKFALNEEEKKILNSFVYRITKK